MGARPRSAALSVLAHGLDLGVAVHLGLVREDLAGGLLFAAARGGESCYHTRFVLSRNMAIL